MKDEEGDSEKIRRKQKALRSLRRNRRILWMGCESSPPGMGAAHSDVPRDWDSLLYSGSGADGEGAGDLTG